MSNTVTLRTDGRLFTGWTSVSVTRSIESVAGYFELGVNVPPGTDLSGLAPGKKFTLEIGGQIVCTGYIDSRRRQMTADSMKITVAGRDKTADLIDCAAVYSGGQWKNRTLEQIARDLCAPYGVTVRWELSDKESSAAFPGFTLDHSETVYEALVRASRARGVLMTSNAAGELVFSRAASTATDELVLGKNLLTVNFEEDFRDRFSEYIVKGYARANGADGDDIDAESIVSRKGTATDSDVTRYRPMIIIADSKITAKDAQARALREQRRRLAKSITFEAEIDGWTRRDGQLWMPNLLVTIDASKYAIKTTELLVSKVTLILNDQDGLKTRVSLAPREGFLVPVESDRKSRGDGNDGVDDLVEAYFRRHPEETPPWKE